MFFNFPDDIRMKFPIKLKKLARKKKIYMYIFLTYLVFLAPKDTWGSLVAQTVKRLPAILKTQVQSLGWEDPLEKEMATHSSTLAWKIPWTEEPGRLQSMGSWRVGHDWATSLAGIGEGNGNPLQCPCLENSMDGGAWWAAIYGVTKSQTQWMTLLTHWRYSEFSTCQSSLGIVCLFSGLKSTLLSFLMPLSRFYPLFFRKQKPQICFCMMMTTKTKMNMSLVHGEDEIWCDLYNF